MRTEARAKSVAHHSSLIGHWSVIGHWSPAQALERGPLFLDRKAGASESRQPGRPFALLLTRYLRGLAEVLD